VEYTNVIGRKTKIQLAIFLNGVLSFTEREKRGKFLYFISFLICEPIMSFICI
jgi:hypothetical protein